MKPNNLQPKGFRLPSALELSKAAEKQIRDAAWRRVIAGDVRPSEFHEQFDEEELKSFEISKAKLAKAFTSTLAARKKQLSQWTKAQLTTSLTKAFADLNSQGIIARENFSCCGTCAPGDIEGERNRAKRAVGYVYYHMQDTERLMEDGATYIGYGSFVDKYISESDWKKMKPQTREELYEIETLDLMKRIVLPTLKKHRIKVVWNGKLETRILLKNVAYIHQF